MDAVRALLAAGIAALAASAACAVAAAWAWRAYGVREALDGLKGRFGQVQAPEQAFIAREAPVKRADAMGIAANEAPLARIVRRELLVGCAETAWEGMGR